MADVQQLRSYLKIFGKRGIAVAFLSRLSKYTGWPRTISVQVPIPDPKKHFVVLRLRSSDQRVFSDIFIQREYELNLPAAPRVIIDAGAYTGLSSVYFAIRYPDARIISIEPEQENFDLLVANTKRFSHVVPVRAALWREEANLRLVDPSARQWGYQVAESGCEGSLQDVRGITVEKIMRDQGVDFVDILKMDIEGSEKDVLDSSTGWIHRIGVLAVELHDHLQAGCSESFGSATRDFEYEIRRGEKIIRMRRQLAPAR
jgi:FkbM family methyltransferase